MSRLESCNLIESIMLNSSGLNTSEENQADRGTSTSHLNVSNDSGMLQNKQFLVISILVIALGVLCVSVVLVSLVYSSKIPFGLSSNNSSQSMPNTSPSDSSGTSKSDSSESKDYFVMSSYYFYYVSKVLYSNVPIASDKFNVHYDSESSKLEYRLGNELVMDRPYGFVDYSDYDTCLRRLPAHPVVSMDGTRLYYVDTNEPNKVKMMDTNKNVSVIYTAPEPENFVASIALNKNNDLAYTILEKNPLDCQLGDQGPWVSVAGYHLINGKTYKINDGQRSLSFQRIIEFGDNYFIAAPDFNGLGVGPVGPSLYRINGDDTNLVMTFGSVVYRGRNYVILYGESLVRLGFFKSVLKINLDDGSVETVLGKDTVGKEIFIFNFGDFSPVAYPDGRIEFRYIDKLSDVDDFEDSSKQNDVMNRASTFVYYVNR
ncbi:MAG: hypothetical protein KatS3mg084_0282 [Candidatus Dojkabacteria bacterium]|nr:MAG: hypothetical protein KatS3mg084_0282 [Candidatus Dojkabacteria bacterium]